MDDKATGIKEASLLPVKKPWDLAAWITKYKIRTSLMLGIGVWMMIDAAKWSMHYALTSSLPGAEIALIIASVQVPATTFIGWAYKLYIENR